MQQVLLQRVSPLIPVIVTSESRGMIFFWTSSRGPGLRASFSFRSSASRARVSLSWASRAEPSEAGSARHTAGPQHQQHGTDERNSAQTSLEISSHQILLTLHIQHSKNRTLVLTQIHSNMLKRWKWQRLYILSSPVHFTRRSSVYMFWHYFIGT